VDATPRQERVVFCGVLNYAPNIDAACWLAESVWPIVQARRPNARLTIVGASPTVRVRRLAGQGIEVTGTVPDVRSYLWSAAVAATPLRVARGMQNKVLEAAAAGLPVVVTGAVADGLPRAVQSACRIANSETAFAEGIVDLLERDQAERTRIAESVDWRALTWPARLGPVLDVIAEAATGRRAA
jgi:polysaccharide biosynthesis protein PslH